MFIEETFQDDDFQPFDNLEELDEKKDIAALKAKVKSNDVSCTSEDVDFDDFDDYELTSLEESVYFTEDKKEDKKKPADPEEEEEEEIGGDDDCGCQEDFFLEF